MKRLLTTLLLILGLSIPCLADTTVTLVWEPNSEACLSGYNLYRAERIGNMTTAWAKVKTVAREAVSCSDIVEDGKNYAWLITAFDTADNESFVSNMAELYDRTPPIPVQNLRIE